MVYRYPFGKCEDYECDLRPLAKMTPDQVVKKLETWGMSHAFEEFEYTTKTPAKYLILDPDMNDFAKVRPQFTLATVNSDKTANVRLQRLED